jgi:EpsI family protein
MQHYLIVENHYYFGWVVFLVCLSPLFVLSRWLERPAADTEHRGRGQARFESRGQAATAGLALAALAFGIWLNQRVDAAADTDVLAASIELPAISGWRRTGEWSDSRRPSFVGPGAEAAAWYAQNAVRVGVYVAHYPLQRQQQEVVFYANRPEGQASEVSARSHRSVTTVSGTSLPFTELEVRDSTAERRLLWFGMRIAGRQTTSELVAKVLQVLGAVFDRRDAQALVLTVDCAGGCDSARSSLSNFAAVAAESLYVCAASRDDTQPSVRQHREELCRDDY